MKENQRKFIEDFKRVGLTELEARVYLNLLEKESYTATEIARKSDISRTAVYNILNKLIDSGMCLQIPGSVKKFQAVEPKRALKTFKRRIHKQNTILEELSQNLSNIFSERLKQENLNKIMEVLNSKEAIISKIQELEAKTENCLKVLEKKPYVMDFPNDYCCRVKNDCGIEYKIIFECDQANIEKNTKDRIDFYNKTCAEVKTIENLPMKMIIFDERRLLISLKSQIDPEEETLSLCIQHKELAKMLSNYYETIWEKSKKYRLRN